MFLSCFPGVLEVQMLGKNCIVLMASHEYDVLDKGAPAMGS